MFMHLFIVCDGEGQWQAELTALDAGALRKRCEQIRAQGGDLSFTLPSVTRPTRFEGRISEKGQQFSGTIHAANPDGSEPREQHFTFHRTLRPLDLAEPLAFSGVLTGPMRLPMTLVLARTPGNRWVGHMDVPLQKLREFPLIHMEQNEEGTLTAEVPVPGGATLEMGMDKSRSRLTGTYGKGTARQRFNFSRALDYCYGEPVRPQNPVPPLPYEEQEISAPHPKGYCLGGTLTLPNGPAFGPGPFPLAVLISGSGAQDRNGSIMGHQPFRVLADRLTRRGIAVMRFDDRGVGASAVQQMDLVTQATSRDFATDVHAVVEHLKNHAQVNARAIGLVGHSEGAIIAPMVGPLCDSIAFMVLMAGPGVVGSECLLKQSELLLFRSGMPDTMIAAQSAIRRALHQAIVEEAEAERRMELLGRLIRTLHNAGGRTLTEEQLQAELERAGKNMFTPWMEFFLGYDPAPALRNTTCPVLAMNGTLDLQCWHEQNLGAIERVMKEAGRDITIARYPGLNHLFQPARTGAIAEYAFIEITMEEQVMEEMAQWILGKTEQP